MFRRRHTVLTALLTLLPMGEAAAQAASDRRLDSLLARMTLEEKLGQLNLLSAGGKTTPEQAALVRRGLVGGFLNVVGAEHTRDIQRVAVNESRLKIPLLFGHDVIHGYRTIFPIPLAEAGAFDPELRATLGFLEKLTLSPADIGPADLIRSASTCRARTAIWRRGVPS